jgi:acyl-CoA thioesterase II
MGDFEIDTRVDGSDGHYRASLHEDWRIWGPNGGYLAAIALRAVGCEARVPRPASFHCHFLSVARFDDVDLEVTPVRVGRRSESFRVSMTQGGKPVLEGLVRTAAHGPGLAHDVGEMPEVALPEELRNVSQVLEDQGQKEEPRYPFWKNLEARPLESDRVFAEPQARPPFWREWYRFRPRDTFDDPFTDAGRYLLLIDTLTWPAAVQPHHPEAPFTAPNLDVTTWFHRSAATEPWLLADHACHVAEQGLMGTTARIWSRGGQLLASGGAQLLCIPTPADGA